MIPRVDILGVGISATDMDGAVAEIDRWIEGGERQYVCVTGVHGVMASQGDPELKDIHNRSGLTAPDGMSTVWLSRWAGATQTARVYGPDLMPAVCRQGAAEGWRMYFYGSAPGVPEEVARRLVGRYPGLQVAGTCSPSYGELSPEDDRAVVAAINASAPDIVWVGLSTPKQERWMAAHRGALDAAVLIGVGAAFDLCAGRVKRAPALLQDHGLEWAYRISQEPGRLWRRYARAIPRYILANLAHPPRLREGGGSA